MEIEYLDYEDFNKKLEDIGLSVGDIVDEQMSAVQWERVENEIGDFEIVHSIGGYEGGGDHREKVIYFKEHALYVKIEGYHSSWGESTWDEEYEVLPKQVVITEYKRKN